MNPRKITEVGMAAGWEQIPAKDPTMLSFTKPYNGGVARVNVWFTTGTVSTALRHPRQGKTQLFRRRVDLKLLRKIFANPRVHTAKGYQRRR